MNITFLETLVWLARLRSFTRTAEKLHATQPAISHRVSKLEAELGFQIYDRNVPGFQLTPLGRRALDLSEVIVELSAQLRRLGDETVQSDQFFNIGAIESVSISWLPSFIGRMKEYYPKFNPKIHAGNSSELCDMVAAGTLRIAFTAENAAYKNVVTRDINELKVRWLANPRVFDCEHEKETAELNALPLAFRRATSPGFSEMTAYLKRERVKTFNDPTHGTGVYEVYSLSSCGGMIESGVAVIAVPVALYQRELKENRLAIVPVRPSPPNLKIYGSYQAADDAEDMARIMRLAKECAVSFCQNHE